MVIKTTVNKAKAKATMRTQEVIGELKRYKISDSIKQVIQNNKTTSDHYERLLGDLADDYRDERNK